MLVFAGAGTDLERGNALNIYELQDRHRILSNDSTIVGSNADPTNEHNQYDATALPALVASEGEPPQDLGQAHAARRDTDSNAASMGDNQDLSTIQRSRRADITDTSSTKSTEEEEQADLQRFQANSPTIYASPSADTPSFTPTSHQHGKRNDDELPEAGNVGRIAEASSATSAVL